MHKCLASRRFQVGKLFGCLDKALVTRKFFEDEALHEVIKWLALNPNK
jgi:hypothetical protein